MRQPPIVILALQIFREHLRNRSYLVAMMFSALLLYVSLLFGVLAVEQETRALLDFGLSFIELMGLGLAVFGAATLILREMETKTIYLILTRPISRIHYLLGRYLGLLLSTLCAVLMMAAVHLAILIYKGWAWQPGYCLALMGILLKIALAAALTDFAALATTSVLSALTMTGIVWTLGHFIPELSFLIGRLTHHWEVIPLQIAAYLLPNLQILNFRDRLDVPANTVAGQTVEMALGYTLIYSAVCLTLAYVSFRKKEF